MTTTKSKSQSLSARRSSPPCTHPKALPESNPSPRTHPKALLKRNFSPIPRTPVALGAITPIGTRKNVTLPDWWLTRKGKEKKALCITGFESSKDGSEVRLFSSGTIVKRHNSTTLEAVDGITICISGFINRSRTLQNGISNEVCNRFLLGFPYNYDEEGEGEEKKDDDDVHTDFSVSFDDIPVSRLHDLSFVEGCLKNKILDDIVGTLRDLVCPKSDKRCEQSVVVVDDESLVSRVVVGVKTRAMRRREEDYESSIGKRAGTMSKKRREARRN